MACSESQTQWKDLYMRNNFSDEGCTPSNGSLSRSPDIIPSGSDGPVADPNYYIEDGQWDKDLGRNTFAQLPNYIYVRGMNLGDGATDGQLYLYYSPSSLLLWPTDPTDPNKGWAKNPLKTSKGASFFNLPSVEAGARFVSTEPFLWVPEPLSGDHYCLVGRVVTPENPNPIPEIGDITSFAKYISEHPNMAWRNVSMINPSDPISSRTVDYSQGGQAGETIVTLIAENAPLGSEVSFSAGTTTGTNPPLVKAPEVVDNETKFTIAVTSDIEADYSTLLTYSWYSKGKAPLPGMKFRLEAILPVPSTSELYARAHDLRALGVPEETVRQVRTDDPIGPKKGIRLGSYTMQTPTDPVTLAELRAARARTQPMGRSFMAVNRVSWLEEQTSVLGTSYVKKSVDVTTDTRQEVAPQTLTLKELSASADAASEQTGVAFNTGPEGGEVFVYIKTANVPVGAQVAFEGGTPQHPIDLGKRTVDNPNSYTAGNFYDLPADLQTSITASLFLNGNTLPEGSTSSLELGAVLQSEDGVELSVLGLCAEDLPPGKRDEVINSKLLGKVTTILG